MNASDALSLPGLQPVAFFGLHTGVKGNAHFLTDHDILYPAGSVLVIHNHIQKHQKFIKLVDQQQHGKEPHIKELHSKDQHIKDQHSKEQPTVEKHSIKEIVLSPNRKIAAITEHGEKPLISIYDLESLKRKKVLSLPGDTEAQEFVSFAFTNDGKGVLAVTGEPDWSLYSFNWEKGKMESTCKATVVGNSGTVAQVVTHPTDTTTCVLVGPGLFRLMVVTETVWRQFGWQKADQLPLSCVTYLTPDRILAGTKDGRLVLVENNELKGVFKAADIKELDPKTLEVQQSSTSLTSDETQSSDTEVRGLISFYKGFAFSLGTGLIYLFEIDPNQVYRKRNVFAIPPSDLDSMYSENLNTVRNLCINISQDRLIATCDRCQLYTTKLWGADLNQNPKIFMKLLGEQLHHGPVSGLAVCAWKPIFMTVGQNDRTVRIWNYETETQDLIKQYVEDIFCIALHPTGLYTVLGFCDKLRYMTVLIDDLQQLREFPIRNCNTCSYSNNGHMFAAAEGNIIQIFSTITFEKMYSLKGHFGEIKRMVWTPCDLKVISCGMEGAVYEWDVATETRVGEVITKTCSYSDICVTTDGKITYSVGSDGYVKEISGSQIKREVILGDKKMDPVKLDAVVLSRSNLMLFTAGRNGVIYSVKYPLTDPAIYCEYHVHSGDVTHMRLTYDDKVLLSISKDGSVCIWNLTNTEGKTVQMNKDFSYSKEILISRNELEEKNLTIKDQKVRLNELETEHAYNTRKMESEYQDKMRELNDSYRSVVEELKVKNENFEADHILEMDKIQTDISEMKVSHEQAMQALETNYHGKLIIEYDKYTALDTQCTNMKNEYERLLQELQMSKEKDLSDQAEHYENQLRVKEAEQEQLQKQLDQKRVEHEDIKQQIEDDADREIVALKATYESQLREEREHNVRLRGEAGVMKKKLVGSQKEVDELKHQVSQLQGEQQQYQQAVHSLDRDVRDLKKEVVERDSTIQLKEKNIFDLKKVNQELDKYKFVLNYKIKELKSEIEPKDLEIKEKKEQIQDMEQELERLQRNSENLKVETNEFREKLLATESELQSEKSNHTNTNRLLKRLWVDLHNTSPLIQSPQELRDAMKLLYKKYSGNPSILLSRAQDTDAQAEFMRQRDHLERTVASLKRQVYKGGLSKQGDYARIMEENISLIEELNSVRNSLKKSQHALQNLETLLGISAANCAKMKNASELQEKLHRALREQEAKEERGSERITELEKKAVLLEEEVDRLISKLSQSEREAYLQDKKLRDAKRIQFSSKKKRDDERAASAT